MIEIRDSTKADAGKIAALYRQAFPTTTRSLLGEKTCRNFMETVMAHNCYRLLIAVEDGAILGFAVLHTDLKQGIPDNWVWRDKKQVIKLALAHPLYVIRQAIRKSGEKLKEKKAIARAVQNPGSSHFTTSAYIDDIAVSTAARRRGIGKQLLDRCIACAKEAGREHLGLTVAAGNTAAIKLYASLGFQQTLYSAAAKSYIYRLKLQ